MTVQICEIIGRSEQGATLPFICRGDDGKIYFVKGIKAGRRSQVYEWIAGNLALALGLPIAPFEIVDIPDELIENNPIYNDLGPGPAFGSQRRRIMELNYAGVENVPEDLQRAVLAFDWWILNEDRTLTDFGGNPNLFWEPEHEELVIIDHNLAFDTVFSIENFKKIHVFSNQVDNLFNDALYRDEFSKKFKSSLNCVETFFDNIPEEWYYSDLERTVPADFEKNDILKILERCKKENFWDNHE